MIHGPESGAPQTQSLPYLTDIEVDQICDGLKQAAAQRRYLRQMGLIVKSKPNGRPLIARSNFINVMTGTRANAAPVSATPPNEHALRAMFEARGKNSHGKKA